MEFGIHRRILDRETFSRRNIGRALATLLMITCIGSIGFLLFELRSETQLRTAADSTVAELQSQVATLTAQLVTQKGDAQLAVDAAQKGQEERVGAFAKQAAKCVPLMQKFGIQ